MKRTAQAATLAFACVLCLAFVLRGATHYGAASATQKQPLKANGMSAAALYGKNCATCHGKDGRSKTFKGKLKHAPDLTDAQWQAGKSDEHLFNSISNGREKMPAFGKKLTAQQIESLVSYVRGLKK
ncbi:MAG: cytochrome c [Acidobacteria bacterium]|nr:cytochrome c [Acidobacteriota bacterium]